MKKPTVTLAISALNEEKNIRNFINSVLTQNTDTFDFKEIWIHSDGSTDNTVKFAKSFDSKKIKVWDHKKRMGKSYWLNKIYEDLKTDILVQSDADVSLANKDIIKNLIKPLIAKSQVAMTGGNPIPVKGVTFVERAINVTCNAYIALRQEVRGGNNIFSADGRLLAYKRHLVKKIKVPATMIANDAFTYYCCLNLGYKYKFVPTAIVNYRSPQTLSDHLKQNIRFESAENRMKKYFPDYLVERESKIPRKLLVKNMSKQFLKNPIHAFFMLIINQYCRYQASRQEKSLTGKWLMAGSTKELIMHSVFFNYRKILLVLAHEISKLFGLNKNTVSVISYHSISNAKDRYAVNLTNFKNQILKIKKYADFISLDEALLQDYSKRSRPAVCLTFDDGFEDLLTVLPIVEKYNIPATVFVLSNPQNVNRQELNTHEQLLSEKQVKFLVSKGWTIGSHSATHSDFAQLSKKELEEEIIKSKKILERKYGKIKYFAYPKGKYQVSKNIVKKAGYKAAFSVRAGCIEQGLDQFVLPRAVIDKTHSLSEFPAVFSPSTFFLRRITDRMRLWERFLS